MSDFVNTIDVLGDSGLASALVSKTLPEEFCDDTITKVQYMTLAAHKALKKVNIPSVTTISSYGLARNPLLETVIAPNLVTLQSNAFNNCPLLKALVLASGTLCSLSATSAFTGTPIASGTGYIYVPAALIDSYKAATNWSTYADQFRALEDYTVDGTTTGELDETKI